MSPITPYNIVRHELIGLEVKVSASSNPYLKGISGIVVDETKNMLILEGVDGRLRRIPKSCCKFRFKLPTGIIVEVDGRLIVGRPEDRVMR
ncbi:MAG: ribonuclease P protein subunit [Nitrososphaerota archaeon]|nr:ribonuclease P protein subunit [Candidatus Bathyarchaeota archaeon]MDW8062059.1 ribonuclease P protein subunit [Nitrososphaerota archaeon]